MSHAVLQCPPISPPLPPNRDRRRGGRAGGGGRVPSGPGQPPERTGLRPTWWWPFSLLHIRPRVPCWALVVQNQRSQVPELKEVLGSLGVRGEAIGKYTAQGWKCSNGGVSRSHRDPGEGG